MTDMSRSVEGLVGSSGLLELCRRLLFAVDADAAGGLLLDLRRQFDPRLLREVAANVESLLFPDLLRL
jgi:hypothetical protein